MDRKERGRIILLKSGSLPSYPIIVSAFYSSSSLLVTYSGEGMDDQYPPSPVRYPPLTQRSTRSMPPTHMSPYTRTYSLSLVTQSLGPLSLANVQLPTNPNIKPTLNPRFSRLPIPPFLPRFPLFLPNSNLPTFIRSFIPGIKGSYGSSKINTLSFSLYEGF
jgi:hypothetical protein